MKSLIIVLLVIGVVLIAVGYTKENMQCPPPVVQFRYIPLTFDEQQSIHQPLVSVYSDMFTSPSPWEQVQGYVDQRKIESS